MFSDITNNIINNMRINLSFTISILILAIILLIYFLNNCNVNKNNNTLIFATAVVATASLISCGGDNYTGGRRDIKNSKNKSKTAKRTSLRFEDHPEFRPNLTPRDIFLFGSFGGTYFRPIYSKITKKNYSGKHRKYAFLNDIPADKLTRVYEDYDVNVNKYKVKVGQTLEEWERKKWITKYDPYGWVQWYCNFYEGRRTPDDERQIKRWEGIAGPNGRFRKWLITEIKRKGKGRNLEEKYGDKSVSPAIKQTLQHWGYKLTKSDFMKI